MPLRASCRPRWAIGRFSQSSLAMGCSSDGEHRIDLDGSAQRQAGAADGDAGMAPLSPKTSTIRFGGAVDDLGMVGEIGAELTKPLRRRQLHDAVEIAQGGLGLRQDIEQRRACRFLALSQIKIGAKLACDSDLAVAARATGRR